MAQSNEFVPHNAVIYAAEAGYAVSVIRINFDDTRFYPAFATANAYPYGQPRNYAPLGTLALLYCACDQDASKTEKSGFLQRTRKSTREYRMGGTNTVREQADKTERE